MIADDQDAIEVAFRRYGDSAFPTTFSQYQLEEGRELWGLLITRPVTFKRLFGSMTDADLKLFNTKRPPYSRAGFRARVREAFKGLSADADVLLIGDECLEFSQRDLDALLIHELCHWYINTGLQDRSPVSISDADISSGHALYERTDKDYEHVTQHDEHFCTVLCAVARHVCGTTTLYSSPDDLVSVAMRFDVLGQLG